eukprot:5918933-Prymnesium_polylepis.1
MDPLGDDIATHRPAHRQAQVARRGAARVARGDAGLGDARGGARRQGAPGALLGVQRRLRG